MYVYYKLNTQVVLKMHFYKKKKDTRNMLQFMFKQPQGSALKVILIQIELLQVIINKKCYIIAKNNIAKKKKLNL